MANISQIETPDGENYSMKDATARKHLSYFGTCSTAAATAAKVVTVDDDSFELQAGVIVGVQFSNSNTANDVTLNVNNTGAKEIFYNNTVYDGHNASVTGYAKRTIFYMYNGTYWVFLSPALLDSGDTKVRQTLVSGNANRPLLMAYSANTVTTTNVDNVVYRNNDIYANPSTGIIHANGFVGDLDGDASTVGGHTVDKDVPSDAVFTDMNNRKSFFGTCSTAAATAAKVVTLSDADGWELKAGTVIGVKFSVSNTASNVTLNVNSTGAKSIYYNSAVYTSTSTMVCGYANRITYYMYDGTYWVWMAYSIDTNSNNAVTQTATSTNADYEVLFSATADNTTRTEGARKNSNLKFNPSTGVLTAQEFNGNATGCGQQLTSYDGYLPLLMACQPNTETAETVKGQTLRNNSILAKPSVGYIYAKGFAGYTPTNSYWTLHQDTNPTTYWVTINNYGGRLFSNFELIFFCVYRDGLVVATEYLPMSLFNANKAIVEMTWVDSNNNQFWYEVKWKSDSSYAIRARYANTNEIIHIYGSCSKNYPIQTT